MPTLHAQGAWQDWEQHMAPVAGLATHALERHDPREGSRLARLTFEILGVIPASPTRVTTRTLRPGRTIELLEAVVSVDGRDVVHATAWRLAQLDSSAVAGGFPARLPPPESTPPFSLTTTWPGGYINSLEGRRTADSEPGDVRAWLRTDRTLVADEDCGPIASYVMLVDTANGLGARVPPETWMFPNVDLTIHLVRTPAPGWVGFDTHAIIGEDGIGVTSSTLYDVSGAVGRAEQILTVRPRG
jgi:acyl-Coa thioesterase superfamily protein/acyl-CoA thioesterase superfamily protein